MEASIRNGRCFYYGDFMMKIIACALILMAMLLDVASLGFVQVVRAWSEIFI